MSATELAGVLRRLGVHVSATGDGLRVRGPRGSVTPELRLAIVRHRAALLRMLRGTARPPAASTTQAPACSLSHNQRQLWFEQQLDPGAGHYNVPVALAVQPPASVARIAQALRSLMRRHPALRARFPVRGDAPIMDIAGDAGFELFVADVPAGIGDAAWQRIVRNFVVRPFALSEGPLLRACLLRRAGGGSALLISLHHIVADGWSMGILLQDFERAHRALECGQPLAVAEDAYASYEAFTRRQAGADERSEMAPLMDEAKMRLNGLRPLALPYDMRRPERPTHRGGIVSARLPADDLERLSAAARHRGVTLFALVAAAYAVALYCESGQERFAIGTDEAGRDDPRFEDVVGHFANQIVIAVDLSGNPTIEDAIGRVSRAVLDARACRRIPFDLLVTAMRDGGADRSPLFAAKIVMQPPLPAVMPPFRLLDIHNGRSKFDLLLNVWTAADGATLAVEYDRDVFADATGARIAQRLLDVVRSMRDPAPERLVALDERLSRADRARSRTAGRFRAPHAAASLVRA